MGMERVTAARTDAERETERRRLARVGTVSTIAALPLLVLFCLAAGGVAGVVVPSASGVTLYLAIGLIGMVFAAPFAVIINRVSFAQNLKISQAGESHEREMARQARRREFETRLANALEMADGEPEVLDAIQRAITTTLPEAPAELLLADNSHAHLSRMVTASPTGEAPGCSVDSPEHCPAARRAQVQRFRDSDELDACPKLRGRPQGSCSAVCVPVSIMGRTVGVIHATGATGHVVGEDRLQDLQTLANLAGNRIGMIRIMAETQLQASTDSLTGLVNRRTLEHRVRSLRGEGRAFALVMADLDHFKDLNDTYGHETGDRALRLFSETLRRAVRVEDVVCRYGGEEFAVVLPETPNDEAAEVMSRVRTTLAGAVATGSSPAFTASFGVAHSSDHPDLDELIIAADAALFEAKDAGRDCIRVDGALGIAPVSPTVLPSAAGLAGS